MSASRDRRRVAVTGLGAVSALGLGAEELWQGIAAGRSGLGPSPPSPRGIAVPALAGVAGEAAARIEERLDARFLRRLSASARLAAGAASTCLDGPRAGGRWAAPGSGPLRDATAVVLGTAYGPSGYHFEYYERLLRGGLKDASPLLFSESVMNAAPGHIAIRWGLRGPSLAVLGGEEAGLGAIIDAADRVRLGLAAAALAGGVEEYCDFVHAALAARGLVTGEPDEPYAPGGRGTAFSEGAALLLLEGLERGSRGEPAAPPLAYLSGAGAARSPEGPYETAWAVERAVDCALAEARVRPRDVGLVVASASGGPDDLAEAEGIARALRDRRHDEPLLLSAPKASLGEGFAFASAAQALVAVKALAECLVPPTPGRRVPDGLPSCLRLPRDPVARSIEHAAAVSVSRRGYAACVLFSRARG